MTPKAVLAIASEVLRRATWNVSPSLDGVVVMTETLSFGVLTH
jgi:hypothetical protein